MTFKNRHFKFLSALDTDLREFVLASLRCQWTHASTALEGNTFSLSDTQFFLREGLTVSGKSLQEHMEISGHAEGIELLYDLVENNRSLAEQDLFALHRVVCQQTFTDAMRPIGAYKREINGTEYEENGKIVWHEYAHPVYVPELMQRWIAYFNAQDTSSEKNAAETYAKLHLSFVSIHPFWDGNGRIARLISNLPLLRVGLPPIVISKEKRRKYLETMREFQKTSRFFPTTDEARAFTDFVSQEWALSLEIVGEALKKQAQRAIH